MLRPETEGSYMGAKMTVCIWGRKADEGRSVVLKSDITIYKKVWQE